MIILHDWELVRCLGKSICKRLSGYKVILHMINMNFFQIWRRFRDPEDLSGTQDRALTRNELHTWLEELASESNTIQAQEKYYSAGKIGASDPMKLCVRFGWFFIDNFGLTNSFGLGSFVQRDMVRLHDWDLVRCPGKSMGESFGWTKVIEHVNK